jgi:hypothetical protein
MGFTLESSADQTNHNNNSNSSSSSSRVGRSSSSRNHSRGLGVHPLVVAVADKGQAQDAGVSVGWRVLSVANTTVTSASEVQTAVRSSQVLINIKTTTLDCPPNFYAFSFSFLRLKIF